MSGVPIGQGAGAFHGHQDPARCDVAATPPRRLKDTIGLDGPRG